ncbi:hypothetical protein [Azospirillum brasilense]|uniref:J domain-containing protein n=1 Tax=Azospirillum brasilense TaxID=192 RepID=A0A235HIL3_AZOBR|nr:hypothetical protein [Azospirillum brasilense]OYD85700.1 hypothetical protein CHT98_02755 [Azospirillum brasilense]
MTAPDGYPFAALTDVDTGLFPSATAGAAPVRGAPTAILYTIPCTPAFAAAAVRLAAGRGTDVSALATAALLLAPDRMPDPGAPGGAERAVLELRLPPGHSDAAIRRALAAALALAEPGCRLMPADEAGRLEGAVETLTYRNKALAHALERVSFRPLDGKLTQVRDAAQMFGFVNEWCFDEDRVVKRFRELAPVYHPDTGVVACRDRMAQLIDARNLLINHVRTAYRSGPWTQRRP